eukprot:15330352-Ditylum_brightwellii.AAC.1
MARTKRCGSGAICSYLVNKIHPGLEVQAKFSNRTKLDWLDGLVTTRWETKMVNKRSRCALCSITTASQTGRCMRLNSRS